MVEITRRAFGLGLPMVLTGCMAPSPSPIAFRAPPVATPAVTPKQLPPPPLPPEAKLDYAADPSDADTYAEITTEPFPVPAIDLKRVNSAFRRRTVNYASSEAPGTVIIDPAKRYLYFILGGGRAIRYGVGVGREGFGWNGEAYIKYKQEWPDWYPPPEMIARQPELRGHLTALQSGVGMHGGAGNPLGARAQYLWQGDKDTYFRIHGTVEPWTIGSRVSSGCIRMINQDAIDFYGRTELNAKVIVLPG